LRLIVDQGGRYAFAEAAENLTKLAGLPISAQHVHRLTKRIGRERVEQRDRESGAFLQHTLARGCVQTAKVAAVMLDDGRAQTRQEPSGPGVTQPRWNAPKYGCFLTLDTQSSQSDPQPEPPAKYTDRTQTPKLVRAVQSLHGSAVSRDTKVAPPPKTKKKRKRVSKVLVRTVIASMAGIEAFGPQVALEVYRRGLDLAERKACVCDGQKSNWSVWEEHLKPQGFIPILDFLHLLTYLYGAAEARGGAPSKRWERYVKWLTWAWQGEREKLMVALNAACREAGDAPEGAAENDPRTMLAKARTYVANNIEKMDYPRYRKLGLPISSAPVESTIKQFNKRVKGTEKFWCPGTLEAILQIRAAQLCQDQRDERQWAMPRLYRAARHTPLCKPA
jgi:hypothetical protein